MDREIAEDVSKLIYKKIISNNYNTSYIGQEYHCLMDKISIKEQEIHKIMENTIPSQQAHNLLNELQDHQNQLLYYLEYMDFRNYFFKGIAIGMEINNNSSDKYSDIIKLLESIL